MLYTKLDKKRIFLDYSSSNEYRSEWRRDYGRLIHSASFRRLQGKTQLFPGIESDFFRNRLTHSMEVAQIAKTIALKLNLDFKKRKLAKYQIDTDLIEFASLAHDLGHPPFGHLGEEVLDLQMIDQGGFEGNAQTLRILTKLEKKGTAKGLNLTVRSLGAVLKYDKIIPSNKASREDLLKRGEIEDVEKPIKGFYADDEDTVKKIKDNITGKKEYSGEFKTIECQIMDIADDIAYSTYDLEDTFKAGFLKPDDILFTDDVLIGYIISRKFKSLGRKITIEEYRDIIISIFGNLIPKLKIPKEYFKQNLRGSGSYQVDPRIVYQICRTMYESKVLADGRQRIAFTSDLINRFINAVSFESINSKIPALSRISLKREVGMEIEALKYYVFESQIQSSKLKIVAYRGTEIINKLFAVLSDSKGFELLPDDFKFVYNNCEPDQKKRVICDFIAGMTDRYAFEFYGRLISDEPKTIFKPV